MIKLKNKALDQSIEVDRIIGQINGEQPGPTVIFIAGIHGNEPSGVFALHSLFLELKNEKITGNIYGISGNLWALNKGVRYDKKDLNRLWTKERIGLLTSGQLDQDEVETSEQFEIYEQIKNILERENGPFYFMDIHTTSSQTIPFLTVNDSLLNRKFTRQYPVPIILGIEEYLDGPLLSFVNERGYVAFGFEGGQHDAPEAFMNHKAFIYLSLVFAGSLNKKDIDFNHHFNVLKNASKSLHDVFEIFYRYEVKPDEDFSVVPEFINFEKIKKGQQLATSDGNAINANQKGRIFMPLYQNQGDDGFFGIRRISPFLLRLSAFLRIIRFEVALRLLPGIRWVSESEDILVVNRKIARFFTKQFFHLLGYRSTKIDKNHLLMKSRETASRTTEYKNATWT